MHETNSEIEKAVDKECATETLKSLKMVNGRTIGQDWAGINTEN